MVCSRDRPEMLAAALQALKAALRGAEAIVIDSASATGDTRRVAENAGFRVARVDLPGLSRARNAGIAASRGRIIAFTDDDCIPTPEWVEQLAAGFADPTVGLVVGRLLPSHEDGTAPADDPGAEAFTFGAAAEVDKVGAGANMAFLREALTAVGGFDEVLGAGMPLRSGEDHDAMWRVLRAGWRGRYQPSAVVTHADWRDRRQLIRMRYGYGLGAGALAAKVSKIDPQAGWSLLKRRVWRDGLVSAAANAARRWEGPAVGDVLFTTGVVVGMARTWRRPLTRGLYGPGDLQDQ